MFRTLNLGWACWLAGQLAQCLALLHDARQICKAFSTALNWMTQLVWASWVCCTPPNVANLQRFIENWKTTPFPRIRWIGRIRTRFAMEKGPSIWVFQPSIRGIADSKLPSWGLIWSFSDTLKVFSSSRWSTSEAPNGSEVSNFIEFHFFPPSQDWWRAGFACQLTLWTQRISLARIWMYTFLGGQDEPWRCCGNSECKVDVVHDDILYTHTYNLYYTIWRYYTISNYTWLYTITCISPFHFRFWIQILVET